MQFKSKFDYYLSRTRNSRLSNAQRAYADAFVQSYAETTVRITANPESRETLLTYAKSAPAKGIKAQAARSAVIDCCLNFPHK